MPIDFLAYTADRRITGRIMLSDDRLSDMLNGVSRIVVRDAQVEELTDSLAPRVADVTIAIGELLVVVGTGPRGSKSLRKKSLKRRASVGLGRFVVEGDLAYPSDGPGLPDSNDPSVVFTSRDLLVALTDATVTFDRADGPVSETFETVLVNRARATWVDLAPAVFIGPFADDEDDGTSRKSYVKDFTNSVAE